MLLFTLNYQLLFYNFFDLKYLFLTILSFFLLISCESSNTTRDGKTQEYSLPSDFGFSYSQYNVVRDTVISGDTFLGILQRQNLGNHNIYEIINKIRSSFNVGIIKPKGVYTLLRSKNKTNPLMVFIYQPNAVEYFVIDLRGSDILVYKKTKKLTLKRRVFGGVLDKSLTEILVNEKIDGALAVRLINIYAWSVDFFKLQKGDRFGIIFTERYVNDSIYDGVEDIEAAFFKYKGKIIYAFPFAANSSSKKVEYYNELGLSLQNFFLKAPIKFSQITSRFSMNRFHPVQRLWKAHKGTDYAAPYNTPIMTTATGIVEKTGYTSGNGNFVKVKHNKIYSTQYLHMSKILVRRGQRVSQGQTIGLVGSTGLATGPHVCYRFWQNGIQVDALQAKIPNGESLNSSSKRVFLQKIYPLKQELDSISNLNQKK